jgi:hypothetical protein
VPTVSQSGFRFAGMTLLMFPALAKRVDDA